MQKLETRPEHQMFQSTVVEDDFFLLRIRSFEKKYDKSWLEFYTDFKSGTLDDCTNPDYGQWAVLCRAYWAELFESSGPPLTGTIASKPEQCSGLSISALVMLSL